MIRYLVIALLALTFVHCDKSKDSLPGSYKLEKPDSEKDLLESYIGNYAPVPDKSGIAITVFSYLGASQTHPTQSAPYESLKAQVKFEKVLKNNGTYLRLKIETPDDGREQSNLVKGSGDLQSFNIPFSEIVFTVAFKCITDDCATIRLTVVAQSESRFKKPYKTPATTFWVMSAETDQYKIKSQCYVKNSKVLNGESILPETFKIMSLPIDGDDLQCNTY